MFCCMIFLIYKFKEDNNNNNVSKRYLVTFWSSSRGVGFEIKIDAKSKEDAENKARDMNNLAYFTIDEIL